jgi:transcriptional regulator with XRE-family HTH domain
MESQHMTQKEFAEFTGISEGSLSGIFNERTRPTLQVVESIHEKLPNISVEWIMFGTGPMYLNEKGGSSSGDDQSENKGTSLLDVRESSSAPSLFDKQDNLRLVNAETNPRNIEKTVVKYIDKPNRKITEIRIFYDDQTWETFVPKH